MYERYKYMALIDLFLVDWRQSDSQYLPNYSQMRDFVKTGMGSMQV